MVWLFWQNSEGFLSYAAYNSSTSNWNNVHNFTMARKNTPIAASALNIKWYQGQEVFLSATRTPVSG